LKELLHEFGDIISLKCKLKLKNKDNSRSKTIIGLIDTGAYIPVPPYYLEKSKCLHPCNRGVKIILHLLRRKMNREFKKITQHENS